MPVCGFNQKMLEGLTSFSEGLVEHGLLLRSQQNGETLDQAIQREIADMTMIMLNLDKINDSPKRILTEGIIKYAMGFYLIARSQGTDNIQKEYVQLIKKIGEYFHQMDDKYYSELEGKPDAMEQLVEYLNKINI